MAKGDGSSESVMFVSEEVSALRADLETMKRGKEATQAVLARVQLKKEASDAENRETWDEISERKVVGHILR